ncbi:MAG TPA: 5-methyltetrahydropteroyltriglutamate--homocysteine methyltransferase, partial [Bacillota bacterium]|nr:5-methyltetrahydropteroyltriglutamate--homocysteine methyltransferase [Bacillota bacterium]
MLRRGFFILLQKKAGIKMAKLHVNAPFRADHVGSLLRPARIHQARKDFQEGTITKEQL